jgi:hypothetical protein
MKLIKGPSSPHAFPSHARHLTDFMYSRSAADSKESNGTKCESGIEIAWVDSTRLFPRILSLSVQITAAKSQSKQSDSEQHRRRSRIGDRGGSNREMLVVSPRMLGQGRRAGGAVTPKHGHRGIHQTRSSFVQNTACNRKGNQGQNQIDIQAAKVESRTGSDRQTTPRHSLKKLRIRKSIGCSAAPGR